MDMISSLSLEIIKGYTQAEFMTCNRLGFSFCPFTVEITQEEENKYTDWTVWIHSQIAPVRLAGINI